MSEVAGNMTKIQGLQVAATDLVNIIFGSSDTLPNVHISIVPFDIVVQIGLNHDSWMQQVSLGSRNGEGLRIHP